MRIFGLIPPPSKEEHQRARIWAAGALAVLALLMLLLLIGSPPPEEADLMPPALRTAQITAFQDDVAACRAALEGAGFETVRLPDREEGRCGYEDAVALTQSVHAYSQPVTTTCAVAAALVLWERDVVSPAAQRRFGQAVTRIELAGSSYSCRPIAGRRDGRLSEHASANAVDIGGFVLADGRRVAVAAGWRGSSAERGFLRDVRDGACDYFQAVLSPDYNRAHRDHLHFDLGRDDMCR
ncbi:extensin family protein [Vitreimonas sp.]|uniref:extensin-like domain-containing protein n=1 Tax=Vitreimonas sp. TaxID=3069702 RepID=UPI002ED8B0DE